MTSPAPLRSRRAYAGIGAACLLAALVAMVIGGYADEHRWATLAHVLELPSGAGVAVGLGFLGRAVLPNRLRRALFRVTPPELERHPSP